MGCNTPSTEARTAQAQCNDAINKDAKPACKPGPVRPFGRSRQRATVIPLGASSPMRSSDQPGSDAGHVIASLFGLAPSGVCRAVRRWPRTRCALTAPFHPCHASLTGPFGGLLSVALSVGSRRPGVTWHPALRSPDFPRGIAAPRLSGRLRAADCTRTWPATPRTTPCAARR